MQNILIIGAGRSASSLIKYLLDNAANHHWKVTVADLDKKLAEQKINGNKHGRAIAFNINDNKERYTEIKNADLVISMLPATMHLNVAADCLKLKKNLLTASYVSKEMQAMAGEVKKAGILFLNEMGLDPGIDHMSAIKLIHEIEEEGGVITSFRSYCGGLVAPQSNDNPWGYKFSWNPRNVVVAGQSTAQYLEKGKLKFRPYNRIFKNADKVKIKGLGVFDAYPNRDSLSYISPYGIEKAQTVLRGTLRYSGYCNAWHCLSQLGLTDDSFIIHNADKLSYKDFTHSFLPADCKSLKDFIKKESGLDKTASSIEMIEWLGLESNNKVKIKEGSPAQILQELLERKWLLKPKDLDMIVMKHEFEYTIKGKAKKVDSTLVLEGENQVYTAMAKTVGLPLAIAAKLILTKKIKTTGVVIPLHKEIYEPVLSELEQLGITFKEKYY